MEAPRRGLARLVALPPPVFTAVVRRLAERFPCNASTPRAMALWPDDSDARALAVPLYERGLLDHCLPHYGSWLWEPLTAESELAAAAALPTARSAALAREALAEAGTPTAGVGAHRLRREGAAELANGGIDMGMLSRALRHLSERSTVPYVFRSVHTSAVTGAKRGLRAGAGGCPPRGPRLPPSWADGPLAPSPGERPAYDSPAPGGESSPPSPASRGSPLT